MRSATSELQFSRDQKPHLRRRRQPAGERSRTGLRAEIMREKGTDRGRFFRGEVDKYTWQDVGSSFLPNEITAAFLWAQLKRRNVSPASDCRSGAAITRCWRRSSRGLARRPIVPRIVSTRATLSTFSSDRRIARKVLEDQKTASARCFTTSRCIPRRRDAVRTRAWGSFVDHSLSGAWSGSDVDRPKRQLRTARVRRVGHGLGEADLLG